jgi:plastocyanin
MRRAAIILTLALTALTLSPAPVAQAQTWDVVIDRDGFNASANCDDAFHGRVLSVAVGDTVRWRNCETAVNHTVTFDDGSQPELVLGPGETGTRTFTVAGSFRFHCRIHPSPTESGTINVRSNTPPSTGAPTTTAAPATTAAPTGTTAAPRTTTTTATTAAAPATTVVSAGATTTVVGAPATAVGGPTSSSATTTTRRSSASGGESATPEPAGADDDGSAAPVLLTVLILLVLASLGGAFAWRRTRGSRGQPG